MLYNSAVPYALINHNNLCCIMGFDGRLSNHDENIVLMVPSSLSIVGSAIVAFTYLKFNKLREYRHVELTFYIAINDLFAAIAIVLGKLRGGTAACWFQGMGTSYNFLSSVFWSSVVTYQIYIIVYRGRIIEDLTNFHRFCWGFPLLVVILPFTTNIYGQATSSWCFLGNRKGSPPEAVFVWELMSFFVWLWLAIAFITFVFIRIVQKLQDVESLEAMTAYRPLYRLAAIPIILTFVWTLPSFLVLYGAVTQSSYDGPGTSTIHILSAGLPPLQGFLMCIAFFVVNKSARDEWNNYFTFMRKSMSPFDAFDTRLTRSTNVGGSSIATSGASSTMGRETFNVMQDKLSVANMNGGLSIGGGGSSGSNPELEDSFATRSTNDSAFLARARGSKKAPPAIERSSSKGIVRSHLADRDQAFERGSDSYWSSRENSGVIRPADHENDIFY